MSEITGRERQRVDRGAIDATRGEIAVTAEERAEVKSLIRFYDARGWDWGSAVEFVCWKFNGEFNQVIRTRIGTGYGRPRKIRAKAKRQ